jgi:hypothetical protein
MLSSNAEPRYFLKLSVMTVGSGTWLVLAALRRITDEKLTLREHHGPNVTDIVMPIN